MRRIIPITLTFLLILLTSAAMADRGYERSDQRYYTSLGDRVERHLDNQGDRIERRFEQKAERAADQGKYRKASHFQKKGQQINRHMDRKGKQIHARLDRREHYRQDNHRHNRPAPHVVYPTRSHSYDNSFNLMIHQPGFLFGWGWRQ